MSQLKAEREVFARTLLALQPYAADVVLIGGWVHALYIAEANSAIRAVHTTDIDVTIPHVLLAGNRPTLLELAQQAGFELNRLDVETGVLELWQRVGVAGAVIDLDLLTDAPDPQVPVSVAGQAGLVVHGYPDQHVLLENARWMEVGPEIHDSLDPPIRIRVPTLAAYVLGKGLSSARRPGVRKKAKDLVYLFEIIRDGEMRRLVVEGMPGLAARAPAEYEAWRTILERAAEDRVLMSAVAEQLEEQSRIPGGLAGVPQHVAGYLRRLLAETA